MIAIQASTEYRAPDFKVIENPAISSAIESQLNCTGKLVQTHDHYVFLKIDDGFIDTLFPLIQNNSVQMPDYFSDKKSPGAHISIVYPNEYSESIDPADVGRIVSFQIGRLFEARIHEKTYVALEVISPELEAIRRKYGLVQDKLNFKGYWVLFHLTIGIIK